LGTFQSTNRQALEAIKKLQKDGKIKSVGTNRTRELEVPMHKITEWLKRYARFDVLLLLLLVQVCMRERIKVNYSTVYRFIKG
jgi:hypothetical protein